MNEQQFGLKELYDVAIKTTSNIEINGKTLEPYETIVAFDKILVANFNEIRKITTANGGFDNRPHVWWETVKDVSISMTLGIFSKTQLAMMINALLLKVDKSSPIAINKIEDAESDDLGLITLKKIPNENYPTFVYDNEHNKLAFTIENNKIKISDVNKQVNVDYYYNYEKDYGIIKLGEQLTNYYFTLEGRTRVKDDITGLVKTGLIRIPKLKLVSDLSMRLGSEVNPVLGLLDAVACPVGPKGHTKVMEIVFLNDDIDADIE